jgi:hypothetical protein
MKTRLLIALSFLFIAFESTAQDSTVVEQYCDVVVSEAPIGTKVTIEVDYGAPRNIFRDNRVKTGDGKTKKFNTVVDALNYMGQSGWKLVNALTVRPSVGAAEYHYIFKKEFRLGELAE